LQDKFDLFNIDNMCSIQVSKLEDAHSKWKQLGYNAKLARMYCNIGQQVRASLCQLFWLGVRASLCHLLWLEVRAYLVQASSQPVGVHSQVEGPSGGGQIIAATQAGNHCQQCLLVPSQVQQLPCLQAHEGLVVGETKHQGGELFQECFSSRLFGAGALFKTCNIEQQCVDGGFVRYA